MCGIFFLINNYTRGMPRKRWPGQNRPKGHYCKEANS